MLARSLLDDRRSCWLLDEPTNHLDIDGIAWLAGHPARRGAERCSSITHDRWFLDAVCDRTWEVVDGGTVERSTRAVTRRMCSPAPSVSGSGRHA